MKFSIRLLICSLLLSPVHAFGENTEPHIQDKLPQWFINTKLLNGLILNNQYRLDNRLNPMYLEADFNGDGSLDIALPLRQIKDGKAGFAIIHQENLEMHILGAGIAIKKWAF